MKYQLEETVKNELRKTYIKWKDGGEQGWKTLDTISEMFENHRYFDDIDGESLMDEVREEMESL